MANVQLFLSVVILALLIIQNDAKSKCGNSWSRSFIDRHNYYRKKHGVGRLILDENIGSYAQPYAEKLLSIGKLIHRKQNNYTENLSAKWGAELTAKATVDGWYNEVKLYKYFGKEPIIYSSKWLHFTAMVWKNTTRVGVGCAYSPKGKKTFVVANYWYRGNIMKEFKENVLPPRNGFDDRTPSFITNEQLKTNEKLEPITNYQIERSELVPSFIYYDIKPNLENSEQLKDGQTLANVETIKKSSIVDLQQAESSGKQTETIVVASMLNNDQEQLSKNKEQSIGSNNQDNVSGILSNFSIGSPSSSSSSASRVYGPTSACLVQICDQILNEQAGEQVIVDRFVMNELYATILHNDLNQTYEERAIDVADEDQQSTSKRSVNTANDQTYDTVNSASQVNSDQTVPIHEMEEIVYPYKCIVCGTKTATK
ncbi:hypothetical protein RDWZM_008396 [Blomia tropicalis]|uniref:SCP domain-containing protein n=1 Tax=Blomia tropicalis TaxID=40697 RepID=A0A9Q0RJZ1_BLOTA|nr:hypothetical protein RDWZM_008396 [Blomia tropicalis]